MHNNTSDASVKPFTRRQYKCCQCGEKPPGLVSLRAIQGGTPVQYKSVFCSDRCRLDFWTRLQDHL